MKEGDEDDEKDKKEVTEQLLPLNEVLQWSSVT